MKRPTILLFLFPILSFSCNYEAQKQAESQVLQAKEETEQAKVERDRLLLEKKNNIMQHLAEYCPVTCHIEGESMGGFKPGTVFIENKTGYTIDKIVVKVEFIKANASLYDVQYLEFNNLGNGDSQSKPTREELRGTKLQAAYVSIVGSELTNGQQIAWNN
jgi:hypothetical protein